MDAMAPEEYASQSKLLQEFTNVPSIDSASILKTNDEDRSRAMFSISQPDLLANTNRKYVLYSHITTRAGTGTTSPDFQWSPFPTETTGVSATVPSPSGSKLLVVRNGERGCPTKLEIVCQSHVEKEIHVAGSVHGPLYTDEWFHGVSWNQEETLVAYVAEAPATPRPAFNRSGYTREEGCSEGDCSAWKGQGVWEEDWGETYSKKGRPSLFVLDIPRGEVVAAKGVPTSLSVGQVVWAPESPGGRHKYLVFVGWSERNGFFQNTARKLGIKYCSNRPCALYAAPCPIQGPEPPGNPPATTSDGKSGSGGAVARNLTPGFSSALFPRFSRDGRLLVFLSSKQAVDSGAHNATDSLHVINWPSDWKMDEQLDVTQVVPVVMCPEDDDGGCFPGLYCSSVLPDPWLSDGRTVILTSSWRSAEVILSVDVLSGKVARITPEDSCYSWRALALDGTNVLAVSSSPIDPPSISYGRRLAVTPAEGEARRWTWDEVTSPFMASNSKVKSLLLHHSVSILKIPVPSPSADLSDGGKLPLEAIFVSCSCKGSSRSPTVVVLHGGPHSVSVSSYSKSSAFLASLGFNLLVVNYRGTPGYGEEALQSLPGKVGSQYARSLIERGGDVKIMMFPEDIHEINLPRSDFESFLNIGVWFKKHLNAVA
ncbi:acylamino-acid-releasing enzyme 2-like isoform X6 [Zea mays]|uniref:acylamino-acid-releasing enzyme 2-like isoform X6 n=1 Tax=Zea mays TaxID=4577 RepID=UPI000221466E|nr:uncharacterized protein LOC100281428 isoform X6 [Zea mays]|eukprot:XP_008643617.1 uncharacterized protein LOC100281428 isoform X7 [Zea mays]